MAAGDVKSVRSNYRGGHHGGYARAYVYDDEGRGKSQELWTWFSTNFLSAKEVGYAKEWLMGANVANQLDNNVAYQLVKYSVSRYGLMDITYLFSPGWQDGQDTRAHKLVIHDLKEDDWVDFYNRLMEVYKYENERVAKERHEQANKQQGEWDAYKLQRQAEEAKILREDWEKVAPIIDLTVGQIGVEFAQTFDNSERDGEVGDWIENPVDVLNGSGGWGYEVDRAKGIKLQITLSLDLSNSMYYNRVHTVAAVAFRDLGMTLRSLKYAYMDDMYTAFFTFSQGDDGKQSELLYDYQSDKGDGDPAFHEFDDYRPSKVEGWYRAGIFSGEDTHITPLLENIERWEKEKSDAGAVRLDLVITDAVLEHKSDIRAADVIQERRDGQLQTVLLNFLPENEWLMSTLPKRCWQVHVDKDNIGGILRQILSEFVGAQI